MSGYMAGNTKRDNLQWFIVVGMVVSLGLVTATDAGMGSHWGDLAVPYGVANGIFSTVLSRVGRFVLGYGLLSRLFPFGRLGVAFNCPPVGFFTFVRLAIGLYRGPMACFASGLASVFFGPVPAKLIQGLFSSAFSTLFMHSTKYNVI